MNKIEFAIELACLFHAGQFDKQGKPYIIHPMYVMSQCETEDQKIVAILHDIFEDTDIKHEIISDKFGNNIYEALIAITRKKDEKYFSYIERIKTNSLAKFVKIEDLKHNLSKSKGKDKFKSLYERYSKALKILTK